MQTSIKGIITSLIVVAMARRRKKKAQTYAKLIGLAGSNPVERQRILKCADDEVIRTICECIHNYMNDRVPVTLQQSRRLSQYAKTMGKLWTKKRSNQEKRRILMEQKGGFLPAMLAPILGIAGSLLGSLTNCK